MSLVAFCLWALVANVGAFLPSRRRHWPLAYALLVTGPPLVVWVFATQPLLVALLSLAAAVSMLRWPLRYAWRWLKQRRLRQAT